MVVLDRPPFYNTQLASVLGRRSGLPVLEPPDGTAVEHGRIYVAPCDHHMTLQSGRIVLHRSPKEHRTRPAIDPLFCSAAAERGRPTVGVRLSGRGDDGVAGLVAITAAGGLSLVQTPEEAAFGTMPAMAIRKDHVDGALEVAAPDPLSR
jgi:two-component system chemotaxis response regulator CheB